jgi:hypothetical protein
VGTIKNNPPSRGSVGKRQLPLNPVRPIKKEMSSEDVQEILNSVSPSDTESRISNPKMAAGYHSSASATNTAAKNAYFNKVQNSKTTTNRNMNNTIMQGRIRRG